MPLASPRVARRLLAVVTTPVPARFVGLTRNVLVPGWIVIVGCALLGSQPLGVPVSLLVCVVGLFVIPARVLIPGGRSRVSPGTFHRRASPVTRHSWRIEQAHARVEPDLVMRQWRCPTGYAAIMLFNRSIIVTRGIFVAVATFALCAGCGSSTSPSTSNSSTCGVSPTNPEGTNPCVVSACRSQLRMAAYFSPNPVAGPLASR